MFCCLSLFYSIYVKPKMDIEKYASGLTMVCIYLTKRQRSKNRLNRHLNELRYRGTAKETSEIALRAEPINTDDIDHLIRFLREFPNTISVNLRHSHIGDSCMDSVIRLACETSITKLDLGFNKFTGAGFAKLANVLDQTKLTVLDLTLNEFGRVGAEALAKAIPNSNLKRLKLILCRLGVEETCMILDAVATSNISDLQLASNTIGDDIGARAIANMLESNDNLNALSLIGCEITDIGLGLIAPSISKARRLRYLDISRNASISRVAIDNMLDVIGYHPSLRSVRVDGCTGSYEATMWYLHRVRARLYLWEKVGPIMTIVSTGVVKRIGYKASIRMLPLDLLRLLKHMLM